MQIQYCYFQYEYSNPPSKKKRNELYQKNFNEKSCSNDFNVKVDTDDNVMKVTFKIATILSRSQMNSSSSQSRQNGQPSTRVIDQLLKKVIID